MSEIPHCGDCASSYLDRAFFFDLRCQHSKRSQDVCFGERWSGVCGRAGKLFEKRHD